MVGHTWQASIASSGTPTFSASIRASTQSRVSRTVGAGRQLGGQLSVVVI
jgi:hypothetical protein